MAILATIKSGAGKIAGKVANKGGNIVAKASGLSSAQLENIEEKRNDYLSEKPETDPGCIKRLLGSYAIEAYEAYLPQLSELYKPMSIGEVNDERSLDNRIRYFEVTKWVTDPTEDNLDKLTNMYHVLSEEDCTMVKRTCHILLTCLANGLNLRYWAISLVLRSKNFRMIN